MRYENLKALENRLNQLNGIIGKALVRCRQVEQLRRLADLPKNHEIVHALCRRIEEELKTEFLNQANACKEAMEATEVLEPSLAVDEEEEKEA